MRELPSDRRQHSAAGVAAVAGSVAAAAALDYIQAAGEHVQKQLEVS